MFFVLLLLFIIILEFFLKNHAEARLKDSSRIPFLHGRILLQKYHNRGAFLNIMEKKVKFLHFISVLFTLLIAVVFFFTLFQKGNRLLKLGLSLLLGGAFSNTYDRLSRGYVVDYFSFNTPFMGLRKIVFNISDFCIIIGSLLTILVKK